MVQAVSMLIWQRLIEWSKYGNLLVKFAGNTVKKRFSKQMFQGNKARQIFRNTNISRQSFPKLVQQVYNGGQLSFLSSLFIPCRLFSYVVTALFTIVIGLSKDLKHILSHAGFFKGQTHVTEVQKRDLRFRETILRSSDQLIAIILNHLVDLFGPRSFTYCILWVFILAVIQLLGPTLELNFQMDQF